MRLRPLIASFAVAVAALSTLPACGHSTSLAAPLSRQAAPVQARADYQGCYLAVNFQPTPELEDLAEQLRRKLGFTDMAHAQPPRRADELHVTVAYFKRLSRDEERALQERFRTRRGTLTLSGYGVANKQAAYFSVQGVEADRQELQGLGLRYEADDAHITFGVDPQHPQDVHNVPKKAQQKFAPLTIDGEYHLMQGTRRIW